MRIDDDGGSRVRSQPAEKPAPKPAEKPADKPAKSDPPASAKRDRDGFDGGQKTHNDVRPAALKGLNSGARDNIESFAASQKADVTQNKDGSVTRKRSVTTGQTTRTQELTTSTGRLGESNLKYVQTSQTGKNTKVTNTYTAETDLLGRGKSTHERVATYVNDQRTLEKSDKYTSDHWGIKQHAESDTTTTGSDDHKSSHTESTTTDNRGNSAWAKDTKNVDKDGKTTVTNTTHQSGGTQLTTNSKTTLDNGKFTLNESADWKNTKLDKQKTYNKETQVRDPAAKDGSLDPNKKDKLGVVQGAGSLAGQAGMKTDLIDPNKNKWDTTQDHNNNWLKGNNDPNLFAGTKYGTKGSQTLTAGADGINGTFNREAKAGVYYDQSGKGQVAGMDGSWDAHAKLEADASVNAKGKLDSNGLDASINAKVGVSAEASIHGRLETKPVTIGGVPMTASVDANAKVSAQATAEASGNVKVTRHPPTAIAEGSVGASAVAKIEGNVTASAGPFSVKASAYASAGAEARASGVIGYSDGKIKIGGSAGAALGLGAGGSATVEIDVKQIGEVAKNTAVKVADANGDGKLDLNDAKAVAATAVDTAKNVANNAKNTVLGWLGFGH